MYPEIMDRPVQVTVKYDGSNGRLSFQDNNFGGHFRFGTRGTEASDVSTLPHGLGHCFELLAAKVYALNTEDYNELCNLLGHGNVLFFEVCGRENKLKLLYDWDIDYICFDLWDNMLGAYISKDHPTFARVLQILGLKHAEVLPFDNYKDAYEWLLTQNGSKIEGIVCKDYAGGLRVKALHPANPEIESSIFCAKKATPNYFESKFMHKYMTFKRVQKIYHDVCLENDVSGMKAMAGVLKGLFKDLIVECLPAFILSERFDGINLEYIRKHMPEIARPMVLALTQGVTQVDERDPDDECNPNDNENIKGLQ